jgi:diaminopropionate ammonia-lyase
MAGLNCETPSLGAWDLLQNGVDYSVRIKDKYAKKAMQKLYYSAGSDPKIISGESGAAGFAGFLSIMKEQNFEPLQDELKLNKNTNILFINTEGDTDKNVFRKIINEESMPGKS